MPSLPKSVWIVTLRGAKNKKKHLALEDQFSVPVTTTFCGKACGPADRTYAKKAQNVSETECRACLKMLERMIVQLMELCGVSREAVQRTLDTVHRSG